MGDGESVLTHERCRNCKIRWENDQSVGKSVIYPHDSDASPPRQEDQILEINYGGEFELLHFRRKKRLRYASAIKETALKLRAEHLEKIAAQANALTGLFEDEYGYPLEQLPKSSVAVDGISGSPAKKTKVDRHLS